MVKLASPGVSMTLGVPYNFRLILTIFFFLPFFKVGIAKSPPVILMLPIGSVVDFSTVVPLLAIYIILSMLTFLLLLFSFGCSESVRFFDEL